MRRLASLLTMFGALILACASQGTSKRETAVFAVALKSLDFPPSIHVQLADLTEPYHPWLNEAGSASQRALSVERDIWRELRSTYAAANRIAVKVPHMLAPHADAPSMVPALTLTFSRPAFSLNGTFALVTYSTAWQGHGTVGAVVLLRTQNGWQHLETIPLVGA